MTIENCAAVGEFELPSKMPIQRIRAQNSAYCSNHEFAYLSRDTSSSAALLPQARPFKDTAVEVQFYPDNLEFNYQPAKPNPKGVTQALELRFKDTPTDHNTVKKIDGFWHGAVYF